jgi:carbamoylphosphate synthase small subunit
MTIILGPNGPGEPSETRQMIERERKLTEETVRLTNKRFGIALFVVAALIAGFALLLSKI